MNSKNYEGVTKRGQQIWVTFENCGPKSIVHSEHMCRVFSRERDGSWWCNHPRLNEDWGPVVQELYKQFLDDIVAGTPNGNG